MTADRNPGAPGSAFRCVGAVAEAVHARSPREARAGYRIFGAADGFEAAVPERLIERALAVGRAWAPTEWYAILVGRLFEHEGRRHVVIDDLVIDLDAKVAPSAVRTTPESELRTRNLARALHPDSIILGWAHGHLRHGARFSSVDRRNQATWKRPHSVSIVFDPWDPAELAVYRGPESELLVAVSPPGARPSTARRVAAGVRSAISLARKRLARLRSLSGVAILALVLAAAALSTSWGVGWVSGRLKIIDERIFALESAQPRATSAPNILSVEERLERVREYLRKNDEEKLSSFMSVKSDGPPLKPACWLDGRGP